MESFFAGNPFRSPDWRRARVMELLRTKRMPQSFDGYPVRAYRRFIRNCNAAGDHPSKLEAAYAELPDVAQAHGLHYTPVLMTQQILEARLLTTETFEEIAIRMGTAAPVVTLYEQLFFDVRTRLKASGIIQKIILGPSRARSFDENGAITDEQRGFLYRLFAYYGGPLVLDAMITGIGNVSMPRQASELAEWFDEALSAIVRTRATAAARLFEINRQNTRQLLKLAFSSSSKVKARGDDAYDSEELNRRLLDVMARLEPAMGGDARLEFRKDPVQVTSNTD